MFVFGLSKEWSDKLKSRQDVIRVYTDTDLDLAATTSLKADSLLVDMSVEFSIGADVKFKKDAKVVVISEKLMSREDLIQCLARGSRAMG